MVSDAQRAGALKLAYKPDAAEAQERMRAFWRGEITDRPCVSIKAPLEGKKPPPLPQIVAPDFDFAAAIARFEEWASCIFFGGESMPCLNPCWGPDQVAAFVGADLILSPETDTSWAVPFVEDWNDIRSITIDPDNRWWVGILEFCRAAAEAGEGKFLVSSLDMHSNADCLAAIRGPARLCMDLIEQPEAILRAMRWMNPLYTMVFDAVYDAGRMAERGGTNWLDMWGDGRTQSTECDFSYMVSPEHFRRFILPALEHEISYLDNAVYHLDGPGSLAHLDDLLAIPNLHGIQWAPGAGHGRMPEWIGLLQRIQRAGKSLHIGVTPDELRVIHSQILPDKTFYQVWDCGSESEASDLLRWIVAHT